MRTNNVLGILFSNAYDSAMPELTALRTMASVPVACRYRLIDFPLSGMVNFGITKVGVVTKSNYRSLMGHLGMGKAWDLSRKNEGLTLLPPFVGKGAGGNNTRIEGLRSAMEFIALSKEEYVVLGDCNIVCNLDYRALIHTHQSSGADITVAYKRGAAPKVSAIRLTLNETGRVTKTVLSRERCDDALYSLNIFVLRRTLLERMILDCDDCDDYTLIARNIENLHMCGAEITGYAKVVDSLQSYYDLSMDLLKPEVRQALFDFTRPVLTKIHDDMPAISGLNSVIKNCLMADGCMIKGAAHGSVLFRGVTIEEGASVRNCVLMQGTHVGAGATLENVVADKAVVIEPGKTLMGAKNYPIYLSKQVVV